jgi:hypothetical protein
MRQLVMRILWLGALFVASASFAAPPGDLDRYAQRVLETFGTPGMTVAIVEQGRPYVVRSYGVRRMGEPAKVDEHTLFAIGSTTKAFTTALLAMLVDEGKLTWETKVADVLPGFKMYDPYVSSEMTIRDIVVHRSGLGPGAGDLMFFPPTTFTRAEIIQAALHQAGEQFPQQLRVRQSALHRGGRGDRDDREVELGGDGSQAHSRAAADERDVHVVGAACEREPRVAACASLGGSPRTRADERACGGHQR